MTITKEIIRELEHICRKSFPNDLKGYLLVKYSAEPFPHEYSEQKLYSNIQDDVSEYESGKLDVTLKSPSERYKEERSYLQGIYVEKCCEAQDLENYVSELEAILSKHGLESSRMAERRAQDEGLPF